MTSGVGKVAPEMNTFAKYDATHGKQPITLTVAKDKTRKFDKVYGDNRPADQLPGV